MLYNAYNIILVVLRLILLLSFERRSDNASFSLMQDTDPDLIADLCHNFDSGLFLSSSVVDDNSKPNTAG